MKSFLGGEPESKYLDLLDDEMLPQVGVSVVVMAQYEAVLKAFVTRHMGWNSVTREHYWDYEKVKRAHS